MGDAKRKALHFGPKGAPDAAPVRTVIQPKVVVNMETIPDQRVLILHARGPLDTTDTPVMLTFAQVKHLAGQLIAQEAEVEIKAMTGVTTPMEIAKP